MLYEVLLRQAYDNKNVINRWNYSSGGTPASVSGSFALAAALGGIPDGVTGEFPAGTIMALLAGIQHQELVYVELSVEALYDVVDFYTIPYPSSQTGTNSGTAMSAYEAYALQSNRVRTDVRRGNKRIAGVDEQFVGEFGEISSGMLSGLNSLAAEMSDVLEYDDEGNTLTFTPVVMSLQKHAPDAEHERDWYTKYPTLAAKL